MALQPVSAGPSRASSNPIINSLLRLIFSPTEMTHTNNLQLVIMAAGKGTRMKSALPKVLHRLAGTSLLQHVLNAGAALAPARTVVITGHGADEVEAACAACAKGETSSGAVFVRQMPQLGTGHAVQQAVPALADEGITLILNGIWRC
jgi:bifunctional UDP-N-acetylglucosamine pyrophosphorylase / glucosamine-1-phosphate N-acetyltransferase